MNMNAKKIFPFKDIERIIEFSYFASYCILFAAELSLRADRVFHQRPCVPVLFYLHRTVRYTPRWIPR